MARMSKKQEPRLCGRVNHKSGLGRGEAESTGSSYVI
jgi:hypothetical protein